MADIPPLTKKTRAIHPRQRGHSNKHQQQHQQQHRQQHQPQQHQRHSAEQKSKHLQAPPQPLHNPIDDGLPKGKDFSLKEVRLEHQRKRERCVLQMIIQNTLNLWIIPSLQNITNGVCQRKQ